MKTPLITLFTFLSGLTSGQRIAPDQSTSAAWSTIRTAQHQNRIRQPVPPLTGFWVVEAKGKGRAVVHFYTDKQQEVWTDTLRRKQLNLKSRAVVARLNKRLFSVLNGLGLPNPAIAVKP